MNTLNKILWGLVFIVLGVIVALNTLNIIDFNIFFNGWWTFIIIIPCFIGLFNDTNNNKFGNIIGIIIGILLFMVCQGWLRFDLIVKLFIPAILVFIGLYLIFGGLLKNKINEQIKVNKKEGVENIYATFSEQIINKNEEKFEGANLDAVFGSIAIDLTKAKIKNESVISASAIFGSVNIIVPKDYEVKVKSTSIFGGVSNKNKHGDSKKIIYVEAFCLFGGIDIK